MTSKWTTQRLPSEGIPLAEQFIVLLLYGKNNFGDMIYSFVKINLPNIQKLKAAITSREGFNPSDFGEVIAAGKGEPSDDVRAEISAMYQVIDNRPAAPAPVATAPQPEKKKAWDEY